MADIKKFLDQAGVSTLWSRVAEELAAKQTAINNVKSTADTNAADIIVMKGQIDALEKGTYDDTEVRGLIATARQAAEDAQEDADLNTAAIAILNGTVDADGSVAKMAKDAAVAEVAAVVAGADASFDTLKEIADWIANDTTGAASMANDIAALEALVGDTAVATQISNAIDAALKVEGVDKYALASDLSSLANRVKALEDAGHVTQSAIDAALATAKTYAEEKASAAQSAAEATAAADATSKANAAEANAKAHADGLNSAMNIRVAALETVDHSKFETAGAGAQALVDAKAYTDQEVAKIQALSEAEILAAINEASNQA